MSCNNCSPEGIKDCLLAYFDTNQTDSWETATSDTLYSLYSWKYSKTAKLSLKDYGLNAIDIGRASSMFTTALNLEKQNKSFELVRVGEGDNSGNTQYIGSISPVEIVLNSGTTEPITLIELSGGAFFQNFFKLEGYEHELLPYRYEKGFTISTRIYNEDLFFQNKEYFLYFGARAENKYAVDVCEEAFTYDSLNQKLGADHPENLERGVEGNVLGFYINKKAQIGYTYINDDGVIVDDSHCKSIREGFSNIDLVFFPDGGILDLDCSPRRKGVLKVYVNGLLYWKVDDFDEMWLKGLEAKDNQQIGVPYNISWGGGTLGLKNHWRYDESNDYWLRDSIVPSLQKLVEKKEVAIKTDYSMINTYSGQTLEYTEFTSNFNHVPRSPYLIKFLNIPLKSEHIYRVVFEVESFNPINDTAILSSFNIRLDGKDYTEIGELCTPIGDTGSTLTNRWVYEKYFLMEQDCIETIGNIYIDYDSSLLPLLPRFRVYSVLIDEIFFNYQCRTLYCDTIASGSTIDCNNNIVNVELDNVPCNNIYKKNCDQLGLLLETLYSVSYGGMLNKLRIYCKPLSSMEVRENWILDQKELGVRYPEVGIDQSTPSGTGESPSRNC